jgi:4-amino-4-deoxy-L-arabinose transferase-like glycosyltransferase
LWAYLAAFTFRELDHPVGDGDEALHAVILTEMLRGGDFLRAHWQGALVLQRPQLPYWLAAPFASWIPGEVGLRFSSALCSLATLVVVHATARRLWARWDAAWLATLLLAGAPCFHVYSRTLMSDPPFLLANALALSGALWARQSLRGLDLAGIGLGLAVATKSLAAAVPAIALAPALVLAVRAAARPRALWRPLALLLGLALPY